MEMHMHSVNIIWTQINCGVRLCAVCRARCAVCGTLINVVCSSAAVCGSARGGVQLSGSVCGIVQLPGSARGSVRLSGSVAVCGSPEVCTFSNEFKIYSYKFL
jgi:hypothetical protein